MSADRIEFILPDSDGCVFNDAYMRSSLEDRLIRSNEGFLTDLSTDLKNSGAKKCIFGIGSSRQSHGIDYFNDILKMDDYNRRKGLNLKRMGSCFSALNKLKDEVATRSGVPCEVHPLLAADIYNRKESGHCFNAALAGLKKDPYEFDDSQLNTVSDESKITLIYAQIHSIAADPRYVGKQIVCRFYDDTLSILKGLNAFFGSHPAAEESDPDKSFSDSDDQDSFGSHPDLLPNNVTLELYQYAGKEITLKHSLQGQGEIDYNFAANTLKIATACGYDPDTEIGLGNDLIKPDMLNSDQMEDFKRERDTGLPAPTQSPVPTPAAQSPVNRFLGAPSAAAAASPSGNRHFTFTPPPAVPSAPANDPRLPLEETVSVSSLERKGP
jgi:hypothetical protein